VTFGFRGEGKEVDGTIRVPGATNRVITAPQTRR
jgi:hypothetical protein